MHASSTPLPSRAPALLLLILGAFSARAQTPESALQRWICATAAEATDAEARALAHFEDVAAVERSLAALRPQLAPEAHGFRLVPHPDPEIPWAGALLIPKERRPGPLPVAIVDQPRMGPSLPADELFLRARFHDFLAAGWGVFWPRERLFHHGDALRSVALPSLLAALRLFIAVDDERLLLVTPWWQRELGGRLRPRSYRGETTPLCGFLRVRTALIQVGPIGHPERWRDRHLTLVVDSDPPTEVRSLIHRLRRWKTEHGIRYRVHERPELLDRPWVGPGREIVAHALSETKRGESPKTLEVALGGRSPARFEWIDLRRPDAGVVLELGYRDGLVTIRRDVAPGTPVPMVDLCLPWTAEAPRVEIDGTRVQPVRNPLRERLVALRHAYQTGRAAKCVLRIRP